MANMDTMFDFVSVQSEFEFQPLDSKFDSSAPKKERCSEQIEIKPEIDHFSLEKTDIREPGQEYADDKGSTQITGYIENDINSWLGIKLEPTEYDQNLLNEGIDLESCQLFCDQCEYKAKTKYLLRVHKESKHEGIRYKCELCDYSAKKKEQVKLHNEAKHEGKTYSCNQCNYQTPRKYALKVHQDITHEGVKYSCDHCEYKTGRKSLVKIHTKTMHENVRYSCNDCDYKATKPYYLKMHRESKHEGISYSCPHCNAKVTHKQDLKAHINAIHAGIKYYCNQCDFQTSYTSSLKSHIRIQHEGQRYPCDKCDYQAPKLKELKRHKQCKHEGIRFNCNRCPYQGKTKLKLMSHKRHKHWGNASKSVSIPPDSILPESDSTVKKETFSFSEQIDVKYEFDDFTTVEKFQRRNDEESSVNREDDHISNHIENGFNSFLEIKQEATLAQDDHTRTEIPM